MLIRLSRRIPKWATEVAVDPDGSVWAYEEGAFADSKGYYHPVDDYDGLRFLFVGVVVGSDKEKEAQAREGSE